MTFAAFARLFGIELRRPKPARPARRAPSVGDAAGFLTLWDEGHDTRAIAVLTGFTEAEVVNALHPLREQRRAAR